MIMVKPKDSADKTEDAKPKRQRKSVVEKEPGISVKRKAKTPAKNTNAKKLSKETENRVLDELANLEKIDIEVNLDESHDSSNHEVEKNASSVIGEEIFYDITDEQALFTQIAGVYHLWINWAYFELSVVNPRFDLIEPPEIITPELIAPDEFEFVYSIHDHGNKLSTSKGEEMFSAGMSMCKFYYTIEKMIYLLIERLKSSGIDTETEVQIAFGGHELGQRKAFESVINLGYNVVVTNFDPGAWGEKYLSIVKRLADLGYGYPQEAPRTNFRTSRQSSPGVGGRR